MKTLYLNLHKKWFDMIESGEKPEEYREVTNYWAVRLIENWNDLSVNAKKIMLETMNSTSFDEYELESCLEFKVKKFDKIHFKNGMARNGIHAPSFNIENKSINIGNGRPSWGAKPGKYYFVLKLGKIINNQKGKK